MTEQLGVRVSRGNSKEKVVTVGRASSAAGVTDVDPSDGFRISNTER